MFYPPQVKEWVGYLVVITTITTAITSVFLAWIAYQQSRTSREKLRLDLYERRFRVYENTLTFYQGLMESTEFIKSDAFSTLHKNFIKSCKESRFLFDSTSGIFELLKQLHSESFKIIGFKEHGWRLRDCPEESLKMNNEMGEVLILFDISMQKLGDAIFPYLDFHRL